MWYKAAISFPPVFGHKPTPVYQWVMEMTPTPTPGEKTKMSFFLVENGKTNVVYLSPFW